MPHTSRSALPARAERSSGAAGNWPPLNHPPSLPRPSGARGSSRLSRNRSRGHSGQRGQRGTGNGFGSWVARNRRLAVALLLCVAAGIAVQQLTPAPEKRVGVLVAARDLPTGTALTETDFTSVEVPPDLAISGASDSISALAGRQLASPLGRGQIPSESSLLGPGLLTGSPPGSAAVPLRMADASSIQLLSPGQLITVVLTSAGSYDEARQSQVLAGPVPVLWTSALGGKPGEWLGTGDTDGLVVVAADPQQAEKLAGASTQGKLFFVLVSP